MISLFDIWIILNDAKIIINARNQQGRCRSYEVVNLDRQMVVNLDRRRLVFLSGLSTQETKALQKQVEMLKLKVEALETMIDIAEKQLKIDIRKKSGTKQ
jgi:hypothetical protein